MMAMGNKHWCALAGLLFGWLCVQYGFVQAVFVAALAILGWQLGRVLDGEVDPGDVIRRRDADDLE